MENDESLIYIDGLLSIVEKPIHQKEKSIFFLLKLIARKNLLLDTPMPN